ncbi:MAG: hypothetical protein JSV96_10385 [Candidatus Aminicenantes bacterium]|nr:MAG: hypothetical protein JSV96_10385 [Candidatus Aminicenantes bacterium]
MKFEKTLTTTLIFFLGVSLCLSASGDFLQKKKAQEKEIKSLIRKELLLKERKKLEPPRRNIFSPRISGSLEANPDALRFEQNRSEGSSETSSTSSENRPLPSLNIRYIGYIHSGERIVGLIIFEGDAVAVEKGEMISAGVEIGKITREEIEIIGPNSEIKKYSLEGEKE